MDTSRIAANWFVRRDLFARESDRNLEVQAVDQLVAGAPAPSRAGFARGAGAVAHRQALAARREYVPPSLKPGKAPLAIALHGNPETDSHVLGTRYLRPLADRTGTIVVGPLRPRLYDFAEPAATDVYDLLRVVQDALPVDRGRTYLVGYSIAGEHLMFGITANPATRNSAKEMAGGALKILACGARSEMFSLEREMHRLFAATTGAAPIILSYLPMDQVRQIRLGRDDRASGSLKNP